MSRLPLTSPREGAAWIVLAALLVAGALLGLGVLASKWDWQPALAASEPWRAWTAAWVHWSPRHVAANLAGATALAWVGWRAALTRTDALAWALAWPMTHWGLLAQPALLHYGGLSGVLHAGVAVLGWRLWRRGGTSRRLGLGVMAALAVKLASETPWRGATQTVVGWDFPLAPGAHVSGALAGLLAAAALAACTRGRPERATP